MLLLDQQARQDGAGLAGGEDAPGGHGQPPCGERTGGIGGQAFVGELAREGDGVLPGGVRGLAGGVGGAADGDSRGADSDHGQGQQAGDHAAPPPGGAPRGAMRGAEERLAGGRQREVAGGRAPPAGRGGVDGGQPPRPVQVGRVPAVALPGGRVGDHLAVQGPVELVVSQPVPELFPGLQQRVVGDLDTVFSEDQQAPGAEDTDDRVDVRGHRRPRGAQIGPAAPAPREPAIGRDDGQLGKHQPGRVLLRRCQGVIGGLGAAVDRVGDPARAPVAAHG